MIGRFEVDKNDFQIFRYIQTNIHTCQADKNALINIPKWLSLENPKQKTQNSNLFRKTKVW